MILGSKTSHFSRIDLLLVFLLLVVCVPAAIAEEPRVSMDVELSSTGLLLGEPMSVFLKLKWENPEDGRVLVTSRSFLSLRTLDPYQQPIKETPLNMSIHGEPQSIWLKGAILLTPEKPEYENILELAYLSGFRQEGKYTISVSWDTPDVEVDEVQEVMVELGTGELSGSEILLLKEFKPAWEGTFTLSCPSKKEDVKVYELLTGGACPDEYLSPAYLKRETDALLEILENHPTSRYAGYRLPEWKDLVFRGTSYEVLGGIGAFRALGTGLLLSENPETTVVFSWGEEPAERRTVATRSYIEAFCSRLERFLEANPSFQERDKMEYLLGRSALTLGSISDARDHWKWILDNGKRARYLEYAKKDLRKLEQSGLLSK